MAVAGEMEKAIAKRPGDRVTVVLGERLERGDA